MTWPTTKSAKIKQILEMKSIVKMTLFIWLLFNFYLFWIIKLVNMQYMISSDLAAFVFIFQMPLSILLRIYRRRRNMVSDRSLVFYIQELLLDNIWVKLDILKADFHSNRLNTSNYDKNFHFQLVCSAGMHQQKPEPLILEYSYSIAFSWSICIYDSE